MSTLPLKPVVDVYYNLSGNTVVRSGFNIGAIFGSTNIIDVNTRGVIFNSVDEMIEYGFALTDPEVLAAQVYFAAESKPGQLYVGRYVNEGSKATNTYNGPISNGNTVKINTTTYTVGDGTGDTTTLSDIVTAAETAGATLATSTEDSLYIQFTATEEGSSAVGLIDLVVAQGTGGEVAEVINVAGTDAENPVAAIQDAHSKNSGWYAFAFTEVLSDEFISDLAAYAESTSNGTPITYFAHTNSADVFGGVSSNIFQTLKGKNYSRTIGTASSQPYTHVGAMGYAMGQTKDAANSSYTLGLKTIPGTLVDNLTSTEVSNVEKYFGNVYINRGSTYDIYEKGTVFSGDWYDEIIQLDKFCNNVQLDIMDLLTSNPKIPQTNAGLARILATLEKRCQEAVKIGFVAPGQWNGQDILNLMSGDYLATGYLIQSESFESQSQADREARKAPYIYIALKLAGAIQSVVIQVDVNR